MLKKEIISALSKLSKEELSAVHTAAGFLLKSVKDAAKPADTPSQGDWLLRGYCYVLKQKGMSCPHPDFIRSWGDKRALVVFDSQFEEVSIFMKEHFPRCAGPRLEGVAIVLSKCIARYVSGNAPLTFRTLCYNTKNIRTAVDSGFPGYAASGMLGQIVKSLEGKDDDRS